MVLLSRPFGRWEPGSAVQGRPYTATCSSIDKQPQCPFVQNPEARQKPSSHSAYPFAMIINAQQVSSRTWQVATTGGLAQPFPAKYCGMGCRTARQRARHRRRAPAEMTRTNSAQPDDQAADVFAGCGPLDLGSATSSRLRWFADRVGPGNPVAALKRAHGAAGYKSLPRALSIQKITELRRGPQKMEQVRTPQSGEPQALFLSNNVLKQEPRPDQTCGSVHLTCVASLS